MLVPPILRTQVGVPSLPYFTTKASLPPVFPNVNTCVLFRSGASEPCVNVLAYNIAAIRLIASSAVVGGEPPQISIPKALNDPPPPPLPPLPAGPVGPAGPGGPPAGPCNPVAP